MPADRTMWASSRTVVVFPFVPVTETTGIVGIGDRRARRRARPPRPRGGRLGDQPVDRTPDRPPRAGAAPPRARAPRPRRAAATGTRRRPGRVRGPGGSRTASRTRARGREPPREPRGQPRDGPPPLVAIRGRPGRPVAPARSSADARRSSGTLEPAPDRERELDRGPREVQVRAVEHAELDEVGARRGHGASLVSPGRPRGTGGTPGLATRRPPAPAMHSEPARDHRRPSARRPPRRARPRGRRAAARRSRPGCGCRDSRPRRCSGTVTCRIVLRKTAEITSAAPAIARNRTARATGGRPPARTRRSPAPHTTTAQITAEPLVPDAADPAARRAPRRTRRRRAPRTAARRPPRPRWNCVTREHREQRPGHPEHHRDDVDHERRLEHLAAAQEREPLLHRPPPDRRAFALGRRHRADRDRGEQQQADRDQVDRVRPREPEARDRRARRARARSGRRRSR